MIHPHEDTPRINPLQTTPMNPEWGAILDRIPGQGLKNDGFPHNVLGTMMHSPKILGPFLNFWVTSKTEMELSCREQELVILRMASLFSSDYVWKHHVPVGLEFGIDYAYLDAIQKGVFSVFSDKRDIALLSLTDELINQRSIRPYIWEEHKLFLSDQDIVELIYLVSQYVFFALVNNAAQVQIEISANCSESLKNNCKESILCKLSEVMP
jgi:4-carboxymuconolactone decarboxylase